MIWSQVNCSAKMSPLNATPAKLVFAKAGSGNPEEKDWIPEPAPYWIRGQARNDKKKSTHGVLED